MKKLIYSFALLFTLSLHAQDALELDDENLEVNPNESVETTTPDAAAVVEDSANTVPIEDFTEESTEPVSAVEENTTEAVAKENTEKKVEEKAVEVVDTDEEAEPEVVAKPENTAQPEIPVKPEAYKASISDPGMPALVSSEDVEEEKEFKQYKSHWVTTFGFENTKYEIHPEGYEFANGVKKDFTQGYQELWGMRLGFGGELYLGAGFMTRSMLEGYYVGTLFARTLNGGDEEADEDFAFTKQTGQIFGGDASQSLGWVFDFKTKNPFMDQWAYLTVEPFVEAGIGIAQAYMRTNYSYDLTPTNESYKLRVRDQLLNARVGAGINLTSNSGFFLQLKATINRYEITERKLDGYIQENGNTRQAFDDKDKNAKIDPVTIYTLGGGYKF